MMLLALVALLIETPSCVSLAEIKREEVRVFGSKKEFKAAFGCAPKGVKWKKQRVAVVRYDWTHPSERGAFAEAFEENGRLVIRYDQEHSCQGIAQELRSRVDLIVLPASTLPVELRIDDRGPECTGMER